MAATVLGFKTGAGSTTFEFGSRLAVAGGSAFDLLPAGLSPVGVGAGAVLAASVLAAGLTAGLAAIWRDGYRYTVLSGAVTAVPGVYLAGAWTDTGWPATMEGAVRSGVAAAREAVGSRAPALEEAA